MPLFHLLPCTESPFTAKPCLGYLKFLRLGVKCLDPDIKATIRSIPTVDS